MYVCIYIISLSLHIYIYIYTYMPLEEVGPYAITLSNPLRRKVCDRAKQRGATKHILAQDKGGPSKGGLLTNRLFSYTDLHLCNGINSACI